MKKALPRLLESWQEEKAGCPYLMSKYKSNHIFHLSQPRVDCPKPSKLLEVSEYIQWAVV